MVACCLVGLASALAMGVQALPERGRPAPPYPPITLGEAEIDDRLEVSGDAIDGQQIDTRMVVGVTVDGAGPYRFIVDSGADRSVIGEGLARTLGLPAGRSVTLHDVAGTSRRETVRIARLGIGSGTVEDIAAPVLSEASLGAHGMIGIDALRGQRLMLDFETDTVTVEDMRRPVTVRADEIVVTARSRGGQLILTQARASDVNIRAVVDTGSQLTIGNLALRDALARHRRPPTQASVATLVSVTGETLLVPLMIVPEIRVGTIIMRNVLVGFADLPPFRLFGLQEGPAMLLGTDLMGSFRRVSLDFRAKKVRFQLPRCQSGPTRGRSFRTMRQVGGSDAECPADR